MLINRKTNNLEVISYSGSDAMYRLKKIKFINHFSHSY